MFLSVKVELFLYEFLLSIFTNSFSSFFNVGEKVLCKEPRQIKNGRQNTINETYSAGQVVFYQCLPGFEIEGETSLTCTGNGTWSNDPPQCKREYFTVNCLARMLLL